MKIFLLLGVTMLLSGCFYVGDKFHTDSPLIGQEFRFTSADDFWFYNIGGGVHSKNLDKTQREVGRLLVNRTREARDTMTIAQYDGGTYEPIPSGDTFKIAKHYFAGGKLFNHIINDGHRIQKLVVESSTGVQAVVPVFAVEEHTDNKNIMETSEN